MGCKQLTSHTTQEELTRAASKSTYNQISFKHQINARYLLSYSIISLVNWYCRQIP